MENQVKIFYDELDNCFSSNDTEKALEVIDNYKWNALNSNDNSLLTAVLNEQMGLLRSLGEEERALSTVEEMQELLETAPKELFGDSIATILINMGTTLSRFGRYDEALGLYDKALEKLEVAGDRYLLASLYNNRASAYEGKKRFDEAIASYKSALQKLDSPGILSYYKAVTYANMADCCLKSGDAGGVSEYVKAMDEILERLAGLKDYQFASCLMKCSVLHENLGNDERAAELKKRALEIYEG